jgi:hypothetical protein
LRGATISFSFFVPPSVFGVPTLSFSGVIVGKDVVVSW